MNGYPSEADYAEAFGVEMAEEGQTAEQEGAEAAGAQPQDIETAPETGTESPVSAENGADGQGPQEGGEGAQSVQSPEERHRQAAARRAREEQARQAAEQARIDQVYADMFRGQTNPYTGRPITSEAEFRAYEAEKARRNREGQLERAGVQPDAIRQIVDESLQPMKMQMERIRLNNIQERARIATQKAEAAIQSAMKNITAMDPTIKTMEDIAAMPTAQRFNQLVRMGNSLEDAFWLANREALVEKRVAAAKTAARTQAAGKRHLDPVGAADGREAVRVPEGVRDAYRRIMPNATDEEIQREYGAFVQEGK